TRDAIGHLIQTAIQLPKADGVRNRPGRDPLVPGGIAPTPKETAALLIDLGHDRRGPCQTLVPVVAQEVPALLLGGPQSGALAGVAFLDLLSVLLIALLNHGAELAMLLGRRHPIAVAPL